MDPNDGWDKLIQAQDQARECVLKAREISEGKLLTLQAEMRQLTRQTRQHADDLFAALAREEELKENLEVVNNTLKSRDAQLKQTETQLRIALERAGSSEKELRTTTGSASQLKVRLQAAEARTAEFEKKATSQVRAAQLHATELETLVTKLGEELALASAWKESVLNPENLAELITRGLTEEGADEVDVDEMSVAVVAVSISGNTWKILRNNLKLLQDKYDIKEEAKAQKKIEEGGDSKPKSEAKRKKSQPSSSIPLSQVSSIPPTQSSHKSEATAKVVQNNQQETNSIQFSSASSSAERKEDGRQITKEDKRHFNSGSSSYRPESTDSCVNDDVASIASSITVEETNSRALKMLEVQDHLKKSLPSSSGSRGFITDTSNSSHSLHHHHAVPPPPSSVASYMSSVASSSASSVVSLNLNERGRSGEFDNDDGAAIEDLEDDEDEKDVTPNYKDANNDEFINEMEESLKSFEGLLPHSEKVNDQTKSSTSDGGGGGNGDGNVVDKKVNDSSSNEEGASTGNLRDRINAWKSRISSSSNNGSGVSGRHRTPSPIGLNKWKTKEASNQGGNAFSLKRANSAPIERHNEPPAAQVSTAKSSAPPVPPPRTILRKDGILLSPPHGPASSTNASALQPPERKLHHSASFNDFGEKNDPMLQADSKQSPNSLLSPTSRLSTKAERLSSPLRNSKLKVLESAPPKFQLNDNDAAGFRNQSNEAFGESMTSSERQEMHSLSQTSLVTRAPRRLGGGSSSNPQEPTSQSSSSSSSSNTTSITGASLLSPSKASKTSGSVPRSPSRGRSKSPARPPSSAPPTALVRSRPPPPPPPTSDANLQNPTSLSSSSHKRSNSRDRSRNSSSNKPRSSSRGRRSPSPGFRQGVVASGDAALIPPPPVRRSSSPHTQASDNSVDNSNNTSSTVSDRVKKWKVETGKEVADSDKFRKSATPPVRRRGSPSPPPDSTNFNQTLRRATPVADKMRGSSVPFQSPLSPCKHVNEFEDDSTSPVRESSIVTEKQRHHQYQHSSNHSSNDENQKETTETSPNKIKFASPSVKSNTEQQLEEDDDASNMSWVDNLTLGETLKSPTVAIDEAGEEEGDEEGSTLIVVSPGTNAIQSSQSRYMNHRQQKSNLMTSPSAYVNKKIQDRAPSPGPNWNNMNKDMNKNTSSVSVTSKPTAPPPSRLTVSTSTTSSPSSPPPVPPRASPKYERAPFINPYSDVHAHAMSASPSSNTTPSKNTNHRTSSPLSRQQRSSFGEKESSYIESDFTRAIENIDDSLASFNTTTQHEATGNMDEDLEVTPSGRLSRQGSMRNSFDNIMSGNFQTSGPSYSAGGRESFRSSRGGYY